MGLSPRPAILTAFVWSTQSGTEELQLSGHEHEEAQHGLLCAALARVVAYRQSGRRHVVESAR
jgi:hypothetical protein